jgi:hypothetical protein
VFHISFEVKRFRSWKSPGAGLTPKDQADSESIDGVKIGKLCGIPVTVAMLLTRSNTTRKLAANADELIDFGRYPD